MNYYKNKILSGKEIPEITHAIGKGINLKVGIGTSQGRKINSRNQGFHHLKMEDLDSIKERVEVLAHHPILA